MSVFHRIDDPESLDGPRFFRDVGFLPCRGGAVTTWLLAQQPPETAPAVFAPAGDGVQRVDDPRELERLTNQNGFMGFEYAGG